MHRFPVCVSLDPVLLLLLLLDEIPVLNAAWRRS